MGICLCLWYLAICKTLIDEFVIRRIEVYFDDLKLAFSKFHKFAYVTINMMKGFFWI